MKLRVRAEITERIDEECVRDTGMRGQTGSFLTQL